MNGLLLIAGVVLGLAGSTALYLGARKQKLLPHAWPAARAWAVGGAGLAASMILLVAAFSFTVGLYVLITLLMAIFCAAPFVVALINSLRGRKA